MEDKYISGKNIRNFTLLEAGDFNYSRKRYDTAFEQFFEAFTIEGSIDAKERLETMMDRGLLRPEQLEKLFAYLNLDQCDKGGVAAYNVGLLYETGQGEIKPDLAVAVKYYEKAVEENVTDAFANLGQILVTGSGEPFGVDKDINRGISLLEAGVDGGSRECAYTLGCLYKAGTDIPVNDRKAAYYLAIAYLDKHEHAHKLLILLQNTSKRDFAAEIGEAKRKVGEWNFMRSIK